MRWTGARRRRRQTCGRRKRIGVVTSTSPPFFLRCITSNGARSHRDDRPNFWTRYDGELEPVWLLDRNIADLGPSKNLGHTARNLTMHGDVFSAVGQHSTALNVGLEDEHGGQAILDRQLGNLRTVWPEMGTRQDQKHLRRGVAEGSKCRVEIIGQMVEFQRANVQTERFCSARGGIELVH
jgi:hypothetical protein